MAKDLLTGEVVTLTIDPRAARQHTEHRVAPKRVEPKSPAKTLAEKVKALGGFEAVRRRIREDAEGGLSAIRERIRNGTQREPLGLTTLEVLSLSEAEASTQTIQEAGQTQVEQYVMRDGPTVDRIDEERFELVKAGVEPSIAMEYMALTKTNAAKPKRVN